MRHSKGTLWAERALVAFFLASLAGTVHLIITIHRKAVTSQAQERIAKAETPPMPIAEAVSKPPEPPAPQPAVETPKPVEIAKPVVVASPPTPAEDPTKKALTAIELATAREREAAKQADLKTESLEKARANATAESERWKRREMLVKQQLATLGKRVQKIDEQIDTLANDRDVLAKERDALKAAVAKAEQNQGSYAVLPYKGANGSWRRPIVLECTDGMVALRPKGPIFSMLDLASIINPRSSPVILAIARELLRVRDSESPDGSPVVPYFVFLVRPNGIRPYYELRARLEPLGIAFGYELIEQNLKVDVPDFDDISTWDGSIPIEESLVSSSGSESKGGVGKKSVASVDSIGDDGLAWPSNGPGAKPDDRTLASGMSGKPGSGADREDDEDSADAFVWSGSRGSQPNKPSSRGSQAEGMENSQTSGLAQSRRASGLKGDASKESGAGNGFTGKDRANRELAGAGGSFSGQAAGNRKGEKDSRASGGEPELERWPFPNQGTGRDDVAGQGGSRGGLGDDGFAGGEIGGPAEQGLALIESSNNKEAEAKSRAAMPDLEPVNDGLGTPDSPRSATASAASSKERRSLTGKKITARAGQPRQGQGEGQGGGEDTPGSTASESRLEDAVTALTRPDLANPETPSALGAADSGLNMANEALKEAVSREMDSGSSASGGPNGRGSGTLGDLQAGTGFRPKPGQRASSSTGGSSSPPATSSVGLGLGLNANKPAGTPMSPGSPSPLSMGTSGLMFGQEGSPSATTTESTPDGTPSMKSSSENPVKTIEVPFDIVVVCGRNALTIHPGSYQISGSALRTKRKDAVLVNELLAVAHRRAVVDPTIRPKPRVKFLVESGGSSNFWEARQQILFSGLGWPMSLEVTGNQDPLLLGQEIW